MTSTSQLLLPLRDWLRGRRSLWLEQLEQLVRSESPSRDAAALERCHQLLRALLPEELKQLDLEASAPGGVPVLSLRTGEPGEQRVLLLGHLDTVWELGSFEPLFEVSSGRVSGPGVFDMKGGVICGLAALAALAAQGSLGPVTFLLTGDEEVGSRASRPLIEEEARRHRAVLVLEPPVGGAVKTARKGVGTYRLQVTGRAAHAGLEPERGINAVVELAALVGPLAAIARPDLGTTVTPSLIGGGTRTNVVPAGAFLEADVRFRSVAEAERVDSEVRNLRLSHPEARLVVQGGANRPPMEESASGALLGLAEAAAAELGWKPLEHASAGGGSDGNFTAALGVPTLDGLGVVGGNAHAQGEWMEADSIPERAALLAGCLLGIWNGGLR